MAAEVVPALFDRAPVDKLDPAAEHRRQLVLHGE
jgi:hypothetical protein